MENSDIFAQYFPNRSKKYNTKCKGEKCPTSTCRLYLQNGIYSIFIQFTCVTIKFSENGIMILQLPRKAFIDVVKRF